MGSKSKYKDDGHWSREEKQWLVQTGAWDKMQRSPLLMYGYQKLLDPEYGTMRVTPETSDPRANGMFDKEDNTVYFRQGRSPPDAGDTMAHEMGHSGASSLNPDLWNDRISMTMEELRQRTLDKDLSGPGSYAYTQANNYYKKYGAEKADIDEWKQQTAMLEAMAAEEIARNNSDAGYLLQSVDNYINAAMRREAMQRADLKLAVPIPRQKPTR